MRPELEPLPERMQHLRIDDRGYPVPWFVPWIDGRPEFRAMCADKRRKAIKDNRCWVCGGSLYQQALAFVIGPMCGINRTTAEPPGHLECARWSARNCPFLTLREVRRREDDLTRSCPVGPGVRLKRNPGVALVWVCDGFARFSDGAGDFLIRVGEPSLLEFYAHGRVATRAEIDHSIETGFPLLADLAKLEGEAAMAELQRMRADFERRLPAE